MKGGRLISSNSVYRYSPVIRLEELTVNLELQNGYWVFKGEVDLAFS